MSAPSSHDPVRQESDPIPIRRLLGVAVGGAAGIVICVCLALGLLNHTQKGLGKLAAPPPEESGSYQAAGQAGILERGLLVQHRGQKADGDAQRLRREGETRLRTYGWTDRAHGLIRVPIDLAMDQIVTAYGQRK
jgi:hypothetical protein